jgi:hypothetical protein
MEQVSPENNTDCSSRQDSSSHESIDPSKPEQREETTMNSSDLLSSREDISRRDYVSSRRRKGENRKKKEEELVVRFAPNTKAESKPRIGPPRSSKPNNVHDPRKVGRANLQRDIPLCFAFVLTLLIMALACHNVGRKKSQRTSSHQECIHTIEIIIIIIIIQRILTPLVRRRKIPVDSHRK